MRNRSHRFRLKSICSSRGGGIFRHLAFLRKIYSAKHRFLCLTLALLILAPLCGALIPPAQAAAADPTNPNFVFYVPNSGSFLSQLKGAVSGHAITNASFDQTAVYTTGRIFGGKQVGMQIETGETGCAQSAGGCSPTSIYTGNTYFGGATETPGSGNTNLYVYDTSYTCDTGIGLDSTSGSSNPNDHYDVTFAVTLSLGDTLFKSDGSLNNHVVMHWAGFTTIQHYVKEQTDVARPAPTNTNSDDLPQGCHPSIDGIYTANNDTSGQDGKNVNQNIAVTSTLPTGATAPSGGGSSGGGAGGLTTSCNLGSYLSSLSLGGILNAINPLNWLLCGVIQGMGSIVQSLDSAINSWLVIGTNGDTSSDNPGAIFAYNGNQCSQPISGGGTACADYYAAWAAFRDLALGLLAILCLVIIIAQALGMDILDAYTIRKMLPRVVAGAIILTITWPLMRFFVILSNDLGYGVRNMLYTPFSGIPDNINTSNFFVDLTAALAGLALGFFGLLSFLGTAAIAVIVAFLTLVFRQIAIILLIIFSPIAIIAYALPNTQRVYKFWWESFSKMLLMFPLIVAFITMGHIFSALSSQNTGSSGSVNGTYQLIAVIAYFAPYFMIPFTFRFAGGIMSTVGGAINNSGLAQGARGGLSRFRSNKFKQNMADIASGERLKGTRYESGIMGQYSKVARQFNRGTKGTTNFAKNAGLDYHSWPARMQAAHGTDVNVRAGEAREKNQELRALEGDDDLLRTAIIASQKNGGDRMAREMLTEAGYEDVETGVAKIRAARGSVQDRDVFEQAAIPMLFGSKSGLTPKFKEVDALDANGNVVRDANGNVKRRKVVVGGGLSGAGEGRKMIVDSARGNKQRVVQMLGASRQAAQQAGRYELSERSYTEDLADTWSLMDKRLTTEGEDSLVDSITERTLDASLEGVARSRMMGGAHKRSVVAMSERLATRVDEAATVQKGVERAGQGEDAIFQYAGLGEMLDAAGNSPLEMSRIVKKTVTDVRRPTATLPKQVREELRDALYETVEKTQLNPSTKQMETIKVRQEKAEMSDAEINEGLRNFSPTYARIKREYSNRGETSVPGAVAANAATAATAEADATNAGNNPTAAGPFG